MGGIRSFSIRSFFLIAAGVIILAGGLAAAVVVGTGQLNQQFIQLAAADVSAAEVIPVLAETLDTYGTYLMAGGGGLLAAAGLVLWLAITRMAGRAAAGAPKAAPAPVDRGRADPQREAQTRNRDRRLYLHMLSVLQREGRLVDFLQENLDPYEDDQIGAAVRSIHANCRKVIHDKLDLAPVIDTDEGSPTTIAPGFSPESVKLTGRVTGEPPFDGIVRHKGWRAAKVNVPDLSGVDDAAVIAPAEVEVQ